MSSRVEKAVELHKSGYNCAQAVFAAFADKYGIDNETALKLSSSLGGGMGGMHEVCGSVSAMFLVAGLATGNIEPKDKEGKKKNFEMVQQLANEFKEENGSIICKQLLGLEPGIAEGKQKKPCNDYVRFCAELLEKHLL